MIDKKAKPFLKWAGGKTQLIKEIEANSINEAFTIARVMYLNEEIVLDELDFVDTDFIEIEN